MSNLTPQQDPVNFFSDNNNPLNSFITQLNNININAIENIDGNYITFILQKDDNGEISEIGKIKFLDAETSKNSQDSKENSQYSISSSNTYKDEKILFNQNTGQRFFIEWLVVNDEYQGQGYHNILLYLMLLYISRKAYIKDISKLKITLDDYSNVKSDGKTYWERMGFTHVTADGEAFLSDDKTFNMENLREKIVNQFPELFINSGGSQYIMTKKGKRKIHIGKRGGKYYIMNKKKHYIK